MGVIESILGAIALMITGYIIGSVRIVEEGEEGLVERLGQYKDTLKPGLNFVVPLLDKVMVETTREQLLDIPPQKAITKDSAPIEVDAIIYWRIKDLYTAYYKIEDLEKALENIVISTMRNEIAQLNLSEALGSMNKINTALIEEIRRSALSWGVEIVRVDVQEIILSDQVRGSLEKQIAAKQEGQAEIERTSATVKSIQAISQALSGLPDPQSVLQYLIAKDYVSANAALSKSDNSKIIFMNPGALNEAIGELITHDIPRANQLPHAPDSGNDSN